MARPFALSLALIASMAVSLAAAPAKSPVHHAFVTSDGVSLHYLEAGRGPTVVFVPGWTMPAHIWERQIRYFSAHYRVFALDPRSQGRSAVAAGGHDLNTRARDIDEFLTHVKADRVVLVGWSLAALETLTYVRDCGTNHLAGIVMVDNPVLQEASPGTPAWLARFRRNRGQATRQFVRSMYKTPQPKAYLNRITAACMKTPYPAAAALLTIDVPVTEWERAVQACDVPILYAIRPKFKAQADRLLALKPSARVELFENAGHALFVDESRRFNLVLERFLATDAFAAPAQR